MRSKKYVSIGLSLSLLFGVAGCQQAPPPAIPDAGEKTAVSMMYSIPLPQFEALVEETYGDIDLQVEPTTSATMNGDSERRLRNGHGTDLVVTTLPTGAVQDYVLDLSAETFTADYQATALSPILIDGQTRYLPLPGQYAGYILNRTLAEQLGNARPESRGELLALMDAGKAQGVGIGEDGAMFGLNTVESAAVGSYIMGTLVPDFLGTMDGIEWTGEFQSGAAALSGAWDHCLDTLLTLVERGYLNSSALAVTKTIVIPVRDRMLDGTMLLVYGDVRLFDQLERMSDQYDYTILPFPSDVGNHPWVLSWPAAYVGINSALSGEESEAALDACRRILSLLSTQEGQAAWMADTSATTSYLTGYVAASGDAPEGLADCVADGYVYNLQMPSNIIQFFGKTMVSVLDGKLEMGQALADVDDYCVNGSEEVDYDQSVVGSVTEDLLYENYNTRREETAIGNLVADAIAEYAGADLAAINGGGIRASLYQGDVLGADLAAVCPYDNNVILVEAKGSVILAMLENGISLTHRAENVPAGRFLQVSGLRYSYRPMDGDRPAELLSATLADGSPLEPDKEYRLAVINYMAGSSGYLDNNGDGYTMLNLYSDTAPKAEGVKLLEETDANCAAALRAYFQQHSDESVTAGLEGRITVVDGRE